MKFSGLALAAAMLVSTAPAMAGLAAGDPAAGKVVFNRCLVCHTIEPGKWKIGPSLWGVVGRPSHSLPGFNYSNAFKNYSVVWTPDALDHYLTAPMKVVPGTRMVFPGLPNPVDRQNVIAYLETLK